MSSFRFSSTIDPLRFAHDQNNPQPCPYLCNGRFRCPRRCSPRRHLRQQNQWKNSKKKFSLENRQQQRNKVVMKLWHHWWSRRNLIKRRKCFNKSCDRLLVPSMNLVMRGIHSPGVSTSINDSAFRLTSIFHVLVLFFKIIKLVFKFCNNNNK